MIASILRTLQAALGVSPTSFCENLDACSGMTRADFLRASVCVPLAAGLAGTAGSACATPPRKVAPITDIEKLYDA